MVPCALQIHAAYMLATLKITRRRALRACLGGLLGDFVVTVRHVRGSTRQVSCRGPPDEPPHAPLPSLCYCPGSPWISPAKGTPRLRARHGGNRLSIARAFELPTTPPYLLVLLFLLLILVCYSCVACWTRAPSAPGRLQQLPLCATRRPWICSMVAGATWTCHRHPFFCACAWGTG